MDRPPVDKPVPLLAAVLLPVALLAALSLTQAYRAATRTVMSRRRDITLLAAVTLQERFDRLRDIGTALSNRVQFKKDVEAGRWKAAIAIMGEVPQQFPFIHRIILADAQGLQRADVPAVVGAIGLDHSRLDWFQGAIKTGKPYISEIYTRAVRPRFNVVAVSLPIQSEKGRIAGVLMLQIRLDTLLDWSRSIEIGPGGFVYFLDRKGHAVGHPDFNSDLGVISNLSNEPIVQKVLRGERGVEIAPSSIHKDIRLIAFEQVREFGWGVVVEQPAASAFAERDALVRTLASIYGLVFLLQCALSYLLLLHLRRRREAEYALRFREQQFRLITSGVKDYAIIVLDTDGNIVRWNEGAERIKGYREEEIRGQHFSRFYTPEDTKHGRPAEFLKQALREGSAEDEGWRIRKNGSRFWANVVITPMKDASGKLIGYTKITRDLTERRHSEEELRTLNKELEAFSYSIAHDLRAPLRAIDGFSRIVIEDYASRLDDEGRRLLDVVRSNTKNMATLIDDLLSFSRLGRKTLEKGAVDMEALARSAFESAANGADPDRIEFRLSPLPRALGDQPLLREVFLNLYSNAIKYSSKKPRAVIETGSKTEEGWNVYFVKDNGAGFDMRYANKLFGVFQRLHTNEEFEGSGVGLAIVDRVVRRHGGNVWADAHLGEGATFYFSLPTEEA